MREAKQWWWVGAVVLALAGAASCTNNDLDDAGGPNVVLQVTEFNFQPITGQPVVGTCSVTTTSQCLTTADCPFGEACNLPIGEEGCDVTQEWQITFANIPKTEAAVTSPFNDVTLETLSITYVWANGFPSSTVTTGLGLTIPANGTGDLEFTPIGTSLIEALEAFLGTGGSADAVVTLRFDGHVADSDAISVTAGGALILQNCLRPIP
jgi:hypothetical protein